MPNEIKVDTEGKSLGKIAIVVSKYNRNITGVLCDGAIECLKENGIRDENIDVAWVPGAWELSLIAKQFANQSRYDAIICLGAVIKGETTHDEHINRFVSLSLGEISLETKIPIAFGLLTCNNLEQAIQRSGGTHGNKGVECAEAALEMANLIKELSE